MNSSVIVRAICIALSVTLTACHKEKGPSLSETLSWMDQTYNPHEGTDFGHGKGTELHYDTHGEVWEAFNESFTHDGCKVTIHFETEPRGVRKDMHGTNLETFNLCDIDPQSIKVSTFDSHADVFDCSDPEEVQLHRLNCDQAEVTFSTHNTASAIDEESVTIFEQLEGASHLLKGKRKTSSAFFTVNDVEYANRFAKALQHAVELCGGKPSAF